MLCSWEVEGYEDAEGRGLLHQFGVKQGGGRDVPAGTEVWAGVSKGEGWGGQESQAEGTALVQRPGGERSGFFLSSGVSHWLGAERERRGWTWWAEELPGVISGRGRGLVCGWDFILLVKAALLQCHGCSHQLSVAPARALPAKKASRGGPPSPKDGLYHSIRGAETGAPVGPSALFSKWRHGVPDEK